MSLGDIFFELTRAWEKFWDRFENNIYFFFLNLKKKNFKSIRFLCISKLHVKMKKKKKKKKKKELVSNVRHKTLFSNFPENKNFHHNELKLNFLCSSS
jgi:hypothetical protein